MAHVLRDCYARARCLRKIKLMTCPLCFVCQQACKRVHALSRLVSSLARACVTNGGQSILLYISIPSARRRLPPPPPPCKTLSHNRTGGAPSVRRHPPPKYQRQCHANIRPSHQGEASHNHTHPNHRRKKTHTPPYL